MIEILKIILRVICGVLPILWYFSYWMALTRDKFERLCCYVSLFFNTCGYSTLYTWRFGGLNEKYYKS